MFLSLNTFGQDRKRDQNQLGWYVYEGDHQLTSRWQLHTEYQWRRVDFIQAPQQALLRLGTAYQLLPRMKVAAGYTSLRTHPYGNYPTADQGEPYPERRLYQDVELSDTVRRVSVNHRFRLEQRWIGQLASTVGENKIEWEYQNRIRYQLAARVPLQGATLDTSEWYLNLSEEVFIGFGENVKRNIFNQNRLSAGLGYQFTDALELELNYLYQIVQHAEPDPLTGKSVLEYNPGFRFGIQYSLDFTK